MSLKFRRFLYTTFILIFIILSAFTLAYTAGYRYHFKKEKIEKSGGILLEFSPRNVEIYLNNNLKKTTKFWENSTRLTNLLPGKYYLEIKKTGYFSWKKEVDITSEKINFLKNIVLFQKNSVPKLLLSTTTPFTILNHTSKDKLILKNKQNFFVFNLKNNSLQKIDLPPNDFKAIFSPNQDKILFVSPNAVYLYNIYWEKMLPLSSIVDIENTSFWQWNEKNNDSLYYLQKNNLFLLELFTYHNQKIYSFPVKEENKIKDLIVNKENIYIIQNNKTLKEISLSSLQRKTIFILPSSSFNFYLAPFPYLIIKDKADSKFYLINTKTSQIILEDNSHQIAWPLSSEYLVYSKSFEMYLFYTEKKQKILLTRSGKEIKKIIFYPDFNHIIFLSGNTIFIKELSEENINQHALFHGKINDFFLSEKGKGLIINTSINNQKGIFQLPL